VDVTIPEPGMMGIAIGVSVLVLLALGVLHRVRRTRSDFSYLTNSMVSGMDIIGLRSKTRDEAIEELADYASAILRWPTKRRLKKQLLEREAEMSTGLVFGIAVPHARFVKLGRSLVLFARSEHGIEWECLDGDLAHVFFLILTPEEDEKAQLKMLAELSYCAEDEECRTLFKTAVDSKEIINAILKVVKSK
jgi:mannitol/fructose-specific phosphotransferase system IIA component (Ntr-type)